MTTLINTTVLILSSLILIITSFLHGLCLQTWLYSNWTLQHKPTLTWTSTRKAYKTGLDKYITFCMETNLKPVPLNEYTLLLFATYLAQQHLLYPIVQVYLSTVRHSLIIVGKSLPIATPWLRYILKGIRRSSAITNHIRERLPITFLIMAHLNFVFSKHPGNYRDIMIWAVCCLAYFGLLRVSKFTVSSPNHFDPSMDLLLMDVAIDNRASPSLIQITLKQSKGTSLGKMRKYTWEELFMQYVQYMHWYNTLPGGLLHQDCFSYSQTANGWQMVHSAQHSTKV